MSFTQSSCIHRWKILRQLNPVAKSTKSGPESTSQPSPDDWGVDGTGDWGTSVTDDFGTNGINHLGANEDFNANGANYANDFGTPSANITDSFDGRSTDQRPLDQPPSITAQSNVTSTYNEELVGDIEGLSLTPQTSEGVYDAYYISVLDDGDDDSGHNKGKLEQQILHEYGEQAEKQDRQ